MLNQAMYDFGAAPSAIREIFAYGMQRKAEIGEDNVFDFSIGNPSIPAPQAIGDAIKNLIDTVPPAQLHAYSAAAGIQSVREALAQNIRERFNHPATADQIYVTAGAAGCLAACLKAVTVPGDEVILIAPYFPEYCTWISANGCVQVDVPARTADFQIDVPAVAAAITERTAAVVVNSPNNPVGCVYSQENLEELAAALREAEERLGTRIFIVADEPYRELAYGVEVPYIPSIYPDTLVCYSYSKSFSLPGERIGYVYANDLMEDAQTVFLAVAGAARALGYVCAPVLLQRAIERCINEPVNVEAYAQNREILTTGLRASGYEYIEPQGAFYLWVRALEDDAEAFAQRAKAHEVLVVPSNSFGVGGWVRVGYCVSAETIQASLPAWDALAKEYAAQ